MAQMVWGEWRGDSPARVVRHRIVNRTGSTRPITFTTACGREATRDRVTDSWHDTTCRQCISQTRFDGPGEAL